MALRIAHGALSCVRRELSARPPARRLASRSCRGAAEPPCPPCAPQPRPPCRATPPTTLRAMRRVCCPPPQGSPPPCPPAPCAPPLTCQDVTPKKQGFKRIRSTAEGCGTDRDYVARRLSLAERERRLDYEREVAARSMPYASEPPPAPYTLGAERDCARATDGRDYAIKCERSPPAPCGPDRTPPPPRCVELVRDTECSIRGNAHLDPCAHVPRTIIDIDRSANRAAATRHEPYPASTQSAPNSCARSPPTSTLSGQSFPAKNLTSRIMEKLSLNRNSGARATCPKRSYDQKCETTGARRAGDTTWCQTQPKPPAVPPCCREPTTMEKIKRRGPTHCSRQKDGGSGKRCFHSSAISQAATPAVCESSKKIPDASISTAKGTADAESLKKVLKERNSLQEAGRGRIVREIGKAAQNTTTGKLDIPVPVGAQNVRIHVSLDGASPCSKPKCEPETARVNCCSASDGAGAKSNKTEPWLSLKSLHKKLASCRKNDSVKIVKGKKHDGGQTPATCPRPQPPRPTSPPPRNPCSNPAPAAPRGNPCAAPSPPKPRNPCASPASAKPRSPCGSPSPPTPRNPCAKPAPSAPSAPARRTCPTHGKPDPLKPKRFSIPTDSDSLIAETLFIKW